MLLRDRQKELVDKSIDALNKHGDTLAVAPTGAGKTIMLSAVLGYFLEKGMVNKACVIAHRDELTAQNEKKFKLVNPQCSTSRFDASVKKWNAQVCFGMVQTLSREDNLLKIPKLDMVVIDEAHHASADSYMRIIKHIKSINEYCKIFGVTATPHRGDKKGLYSTFSNVADQITIQELISSGHLVRPSFFVVDVGVQEELSNVRQKGSDYDMDQVSKIMNTSPVNSEVVRHWKDKAGDRQTVVFCSTIQHASDVTDAFCAGGIQAQMVWGDMGDGERKEVLDDFEQGKVQVLVNVAVLTEGWDCQPVSCIVLLRPSSHKSTLTQMIGRGLRIVDPAIYPDVIKKDCVVLDFGSSLVKHGFFDQRADLHDKPKGVCPERPECTEKTDPILSDAIEMKEWDGFKNSHFEWYNVQGKGHWFVATGFDVWGTVFCGKYNCYAFGGIKKGSPADKRPRLLMKGTKVNCLARANDWINMREFSDSAYKSKSWVSQPATPNQLGLLHPSFRFDYSLTKYQASAIISIQGSLSEMKRIIEGKAR